MPLRNGLQGNLLRCKRDKTRAEKTVKTKNLVLAVFFYGLEGIFPVLLFSGSGGWLNPPGIGGGSNRLAARQS